MPRVGFEPTIPAFRASENSSCLRRRGHCDRQHTTCLANIKTSLMRFSLIKVYEKVKWHPVMSQVLLIDL
jgi:hypothetical protein